MGRIVTIDRHIMEQQSRSPTATGEFSWLLCGITLATRMIASLVRQAGLSDLVGATGQKNIHGEEVQKLDEAANCALRECLGYRGNVGIIASEEDDEPIVLDRGGKGRYVVLFDPLDGSGNIASAMPVGTIFSVLERGARRRSKRGIAGAVLQPGRRQLAAGYVVYGSSTVLCYTTGSGVHMFVLDPAVGAFVLVRENVTIPAGKKVYSVNEAYYRCFPAGYREWLDWTKTEGYKMRCHGALVADFHRLLVGGGVFAYPPTADHPQGKLRLMYEANPIAFVAEQAGGRATDGASRILEKQPGSLHERTPLLVGGLQEVLAVEGFLA